MALAHGDAYPRALGFSAWSGIAPKGKKLVDVQYLTIPGTIGDNATNTQTGGMIPLADGSFGIVFATAIGRLAYDVCYKRISKAGALLDSAWLTSYSATAFAIYPRIAAYGKQILILWEEVTGNVVSVQRLVVSPRGVILSGKKNLESAARLSPFYDCVALPSGDVLWATLRASDTLAINRIKLQ